MRRTHSVQDWKNIGISPDVVGQLEVPELGSTLAAYLLQYSDNTYELISIRECLNECFKCEHVTGASLLGCDRMT